MLLPLLQNNLLGSPADSSVYLSGSGGGTSDGTGIMTISMNCSGSGGGTCDGTATMIMTVNMIGSGGGDSGGTGLLTIGGTIIKLLRNASLRLGNRLRI